MGRKRLATYPRGDSDDEVRAHVMREWIRIPGATAVHCGGRGLAVGCPVCGKRWP